MENFGFIKVAAAVPSVRVADCRHNADCIAKLLREACAGGVQIAVFPELSLTAYSCGDLFQNALLLDEAERALQHLLDAGKQLDIVGIVGMPVRLHNQLFNCAVVFSRGRILGVVPKTFLPNYNEFYEKRWFASAADATATEMVLCGQTVPFGAQLLFESANVTFAIELCEDLWTPIPPSSHHALAGAQVIFNLSASDEVIGKHAYLRNLVMQQSARCIAGYVYASAGFGESSTDLVFAGNAFVAENGSMLTESTRFSRQPQLAISDIDIEYLQHERRKNSTFMLGATRGYTRVPCALSAARTPLSRSFDPWPFVPPRHNMATTCEEIFEMQATALATRLQATGIKSLVLGISGGLDSTLALLVCARTCDKLGLSRQQIIGVTMPGFGTTDRTYHNATELVEHIGATLREISIKAACTQHFADIGHDSNIHDATYENTQARERTQILMDIANQCGGLVVGTGDLSELALGWATYNGDHMSMYAVNASIPKTLVRHLVQYAAECNFASTAAHNLRDIVDTPVSPELLPADDKGCIAQKTEDLVGPYELHDFFIYHMLRHGFAPDKLFMLAQRAFADRYEPAIIKHWLKTFVRRFFSQQFKRSCMPDGPKIGSVNLSPRGDWRMPSDVSAAIWLAQVETL
ncbi:MAG: NAD(+) synthase [Paludibacteraceae bacterium]|nr:NAD(+) synthase [Paludibacteraceae bacterium]